MKARHALLLLTLIAAGSKAAPQDFREAVELQPVQARPVAELALPDSVYQGVTRADLADLDVFNAEGTPVPHAFCAPPQPAAEAPVPTEQALPVFPLQGAKPAASGTSRVDVTGRDGLAVTVQSATPAATGGSEVSAYVIDARQLPHALLALRVRWRSPDGASELHVRIEESEDLDQWRVLVPHTTLVHAGAAGQTLQRELIPLPQGPRNYLRISRQDAGPAPILDEVLGEMQLPARQEPEQPVWFSATPLPLEPGQPGSYDAQRLAPVTTADIALPAPNMDLEVALQSRPGTTAEWRTVWSGPLYDIGSGEERRSSPRPRFAPDSDRYWRIQLLQGAPTLGGGELALKLGYHPLHLRFLEQGSAPYQLAYGSARVPPQGPSYACDSLLQGLPRAELQNLIGAVGIGAPHPLGGESALQPLPPPKKPTPARQIVLWAVLLLGAALVVWMALSLLGRIRRDG